MNKPKYQIGEQFITPKGVVKITDCFLIANRNPNRNSDDETYEYWFEYIELNPGHNGFWIHGQEWQITEALGEDKLPKNTSNETSNY